MKDGNPLLDPPIKQDEIAPYLILQSRPHLPNHFPPQIPLKVGLDRPPDSIPIRRALETGVQSLRRLRSTTARSSMRPPVPHPATTTRRGQRSAESWKEFLNNLLPRRNLYLVTPTPGILINYILSPPSSDRPYQQE